MDCSMSLQQIIDRCLEKGINCIAIADHGTAEGGLKMRELAPFKVIVAEEILTPHGEIMGLFLEETVPSRISAEQAISRIRAQGGLVCCCPGGTASNVIAYLAKADVALSVSMTAFSTMLAATCTPLLTTWIVGSRVDVDSWGLFLSTAKVVLLPYVAEREVPIGHGSRHTTYTNVVGEIRVLGDWSGAALRETVPAQTLKGYDGVAVLLQQGSTEKPGAILGAARATLR